MGLGAITEGITGEISAQTNQEICRPMRIGAKQQPPYPCESVRNERLNHGRVQLAHASVLRPLLPMPHRTVITSGASHYGDYVT